MEHVLKDILGDFADTPSSKSSKAKRKAKHGAADAAAVADHTQAMEKEAAADLAALAPTNGAASAALAEVTREVDEQEAELLRSWLVEQKAAAEAARKAAEAAAEEDVMVGPDLPEQQKAARNKYGFALLPGEGDRMAAYVQSGKRIPRRGEVGLTADQIEHFENLGYIMSGSRHSRMNAIRIRKENQIYSAEEKAALAMFNFEENKRKEARILEDLQKLVSRTLTTQGGAEFGNGAGEGDADGAGEE